jgi:hypothetical protein
LRLLRIAGGAGAAWEIEIASRIVPQRPPLLDLFFPSPPLVSAWLEIIAYDILEKSPIRRKSREMAVSRFRRLRRRVSSSAMTIT